MNVETWPIDRPIPYARNPRKNSGAIDRVAASLKEFSWKQPIVVDKEGVVVVGHTRLLAAKKLGWTDVPVVVASDLTPAQCKAYRISDNRSNEEAEWDKELLGLELLDLNALDFDLSLTAFDADELKEIQTLSSTAPTDPSDDESPELPDEPVCNLADLWSLGVHRLLIADSTSTDNVKRLLGSDKVDLVFTDPPYGIDIVKAFKCSIGDTKAFGSTGGGKANIIKKNSYSPIVGDKTAETAEKFVNCCASLRLNNQVIWGGNYFTHFLPPRKCWLVWDKKGREWNDDFSDFEMAWSSYDKPAKIFTHVWMGIVQSGKREKRVHPTQKPIDFIARCIDYVEPDAKVILDGFGGSGSTLLACERTGRKALLCELSPAYGDVIIQRFQDFTGREAIREDGVKFNDLKPAVDVAAA